MTEFCPTCAGPKSAEWSTDWGHCDDPFHSPSLAEVADHPEVVIDHQQSLRVLSALAGEAVEALREKDAEIGRLKNHHEATVAQTDRVLREKDRRIASLEALSRFLIPGHTKWRQHLIDGDTDE